MSSSQIIGDLEIVQYLDDLGTGNLLVHGNVIIKGQELIVDKVNLLKKIQDLEKHITQMQEHITQMYYAPGMPGYLETQKEFESNF